MLPVALTIAGSDPTCGAGLGADLRTFTAHGVWGCAIPSAITVQSTRGVTDVVPLAPDLVARQLDTLVADVALGAWKTGALGSRAIVEMLADRASRLTAPLVVDPVLLATSGAPLLDADARDALIRLLVPHAALITPNAPEAATLTGRSVETVEQARDAARALIDLGARAVLVKGGHLARATRAPSEDREGHVIDVLLFDGALHELSSPRVALSAHVHGTGCALSAAITARLARGETLGEACRGAKHWMSAALAEAHALAGGDWVLGVPRGA